MTSISIILTAIAVVAFSGLPAYLFPSRSPLSQKLTTFLMVAGCATGLYGLALMIGSAEQSIRFPWFIPIGRFSVTVDALSGFFLALVFFIPALGSIYGLGYWKQTEHPVNGRALGLSFGLLAASMALVAIARDGVLFMIAWEAMALSAYFAATVESENASVREAGWIYLVATHVGTMFLLAMFALWHGVSGSFDLGATNAIPPAAAGSIFVLSVVGFGFKAGLIPLHFWLPDAHSNAPSHVSAVMSGVMLKMGIYGIIRMASFFELPPSWWGGVLLAAGSITGVIGIAFAISQTDMKRLLAYSSIENIGIITMGLGLALLGRSYGRADWLLLGMGAALFHVWNHGLFKSLLFFNAGAIIHATGTRNIESLGGLGRKMPRSMLFFVIGAIAICALPPLNGFAGEFLLYVGLFKTLGLNGGPSLPAAAPAIIALSTIGALAIATLVKMFGTVFLGSSRSSATEHAHDPCSLMILPMIIISALCAAFGVVPVVIMPLIEAATKVWAIPARMTESITALVPLQWISFAALVLVALIVLISLLFRVKAKTAYLSALPARPLTWDCGYAVPTARMQYTGSSFSHTIVELFKYVIFPKHPQPSVLGAFPGKSEYSGEVPDTIYVRIVIPLANAGSRIQEWFRFLQQGQTHLYVLYIFIILIVLLVGGGVL